VEEDCAASSVFRVAILVLPELVILEGIKIENAFQNQKLYWIIISFLFCTKNG
jgi:hypothetical protein